MGSETLEGSLAGLDEQSWSVLERLARALHVKDAGLQPTLDAIVATAVSTIEPASYAGLILLVKGSLRPQSTLGEPPHELDLLQQQLGQGPCVDAARRQITISVPDTRTESRWPGFCERAASLGVGSMLCVPLQVDEQTLGALSLYAVRPAAFRDSDQQLVELFATHAALALGDARRAVQLREGMTNRDLIGQAKGILVERLRLTPDTAFQRLAQVSQATNRKLSEVAQHLVETGELLS